MLKPETRPRLRVLRSRLHELLPEHQRKKITALAKGIGIAPNTLRAILRDDWEQVSRETIERVCDFFQIEIAELLEFRPCLFWEAFADSNQYVLLRKAYNAKDANARSVVTSFLAEIIPSIKVKSPTDPRTMSQIGKHLRGDNCLVVGSPQSNPVSESVIAMLCGATTPKSGPIAIEALPYRFVFPKGREIKSAIVESYSEERGEGSHVGIVDLRTGRFAIEADWRSEVEFRESEIDHGRDGAIIMVTDRPLDSRRNVKTIVMAGFSSIGTEAAVRALVRDFRYLEPSPGSQSVIGVVEASYRKSRSTQDGRILTGFSWKRLEGARKQVPL